MVARTRRASRGPIKPGTIVPTEGVRAIATAAATRMSTGATSLTGGRAVPPIADDPPVAVAHLTRELVRPRAMSNVGVQSVMSPSDPVAAIYRRHPGQDHALSLRRNYKKPLCGSTHSKMGFQAAAQAMPDSAEKS